MNRINRARFFVANFFNNRPLCFLSTVAGLRDLILGISMIIGVDHIKNTLLYANYNTLAPAWVAGISFAVIGLVVMVFALLDKVPMARAGLTLQASIWLFSAFMYALNENWIFAIFLGGYFSLVAGYTAFYYKYAPLWDSQKKTFRDQWIAENDPFAHITDRRAA